MKIKEALNHLTNNPDFDDDIITYLGTKDRHAINKAIRALSSIEYIELKIEAYEDFSAYDRMIARKVLKFLIDFIEGEANETN